MKDKMIDNMNSFATEYLFKQYSKRTRKMAGEKLIINYSHYVGQTFHQRYPIHHKS